MKVPYISAVILVLPLLIALVTFNMYLPALGLLAIFALAVFLGRGGVEDRKPSAMEWLFTFLGSMSVLVVALPITALFADVDLSSAIGDDAVLEAFYISAAAGFTATLIALAISLPAGYILVRRDFPGKSVVEGLIDLPVVVPHTVAGIAILVVFGRIKNLGVSGLMDSFWGIVGAMLFVALPFMMNHIKEGVKSIDPRLELVAQSLGSTPGGAYVRVVLPILIPAIISGCLMTFARAVSEFGAVVIIAYYPTTAPVLIYDRFLSFGLAASRPIAALFLLFTGIVFILMRFISLRLGGGGRG